jgi:hypothetical protein
MLLDRRSFFRWFGVGALLGGLALVLAPLRSLAQILQ